MIHQPHYQRFYAHSWPWLLMFFCGLGAGGPPMALAQNAAPPMVGDGEAGQGDGIPLSTNGPPAGIDGVDAAAEGGHGQASDGLPGLSPPSKPLERIDLGALLSEGQGEDETLLWDLSTDEGGEALTLDGAIATAIHQNLGIRTAVIRQDSIALNLESQRGRFDPTLNMQARPYQTVSVCTSSVECADPSGIVINNNLLIGLGIDQFLPTGATFSVGASVSRQFSNRDDFVGDDPVTSTQGTLSIIQPLLRGGGYVINQLDFERILLEQRISDINLRQSLEDLVLGVHRAYWALMLERAMLSLREQSLAFAQEQARVTEERIALGFVAPVEIFAARQMVASREVEVQLAANGVKQAEFELRKWMNLPLQGDGALIPIDPPPSTGPQLEAEEILAQARAWDSRLRALKMESEQIQLNRSQAVNQALPSLNLSAGTGYVLTGAGGESAPSWDAALTLSTQLGWRSARANIAQQDISQRVADMAIATRLQDLEADILMGLRTYETAAQRVELSRQARFLAEKKLEAERERLERGESTLKNLLDYLEDRDEARLVELRAHRDFATARLQIEALSGALLPALEITVESVQP